jgi:DNA-binding beta-propeller fold protein YncE
MPRLLIALLSIAILGCSTSSPLLPGRTADGRVLLPNGWYLSPAGEHAGVGELPLNMVATPDGKYIVITNNGTKEQSLSLLRTADWKVVQDLPVRKSWLGLALTAGGRRVVASGGNDNRVLIYRLEGERLTLEDSIAIGAPRPVQMIWTAGLAVSPDGDRVFVAGRESDSLYELSLSARRVTRRTHLPAKPYTCLLSSNGERLYVSLWGGSAVEVFDASSLTQVASVPVGDHPCDMVESPDGSRLFVANANHNSVSIISLPDLKVLETILTSLTPGAPYGSTPNALALSPNGKRLYVANADNNYIALFDVSVRGASRALGFIPTGWYPTALLTLPGSGQIVVANGKGTTSQANVHGPQPTLRSTPSTEYIGSLFKGTVARIPDPSPEQLAEYSAQVYRNSPYTDARRDAPGTDPANPVPKGKGGTSPIKHVFYIIKENRTYDQVFGDLKQGNGEPNLCLFPDSITPNHHALVREFVLLDNLYCNAEVSADGHNWSMGAYATDYVEKSWPTSYGGRGGEYEFEGGYPTAYPSNGYLWDNCKRSGVSYRSYGEFAENPSRTGDSAKATMPALEGHVAPFYRGWDLEYSDVDRAREFIREFDAYEKNGGLPQLVIVKLPNNHTEGTRKGSLTPRSFVAQNDLALGMVVERISKSKYWKESAIFVIEDDAQNGPDHVDAHRTVALVISPWTKRGFVDSELYSTTSMVRTMGLILGLPPLSQFDAASTPMYNSFASAPDLRPYTCRPATYSLTERNPAGVYGQLRTSMMDFSAEDRIPDVEFSEIIWRSVKGTPMPPPVRSAFVRTAPDEDD